MMSPAEHIQGLRAQTQREYDRRMAAIDALAESFGLGPSESEVTEENEEGERLTIADAVRAVFEDQPSQGLTLSAVSMGIRGQVSKPKGPLKSAVAATLSNLKKRGELYHDKENSLYYKMGYHPGAVQPPLNVTLPDLGQILDPT